MACTGLKDLWLSRNETGNGRMEVPLRRGPGVLLSTLGNHPESQSARGFRGCRGGDRKSVFWRLRRGVWGGGQVEITLGNLHMNSDNGDFCKGAFAGVYCRGYGAELGIGKMVLFGISTRPGFRLREYKHPPSPGVFCREPPFSFYRAGPSVSSCHIVLALSSFAIWFSLILICDRLKISAFSRGDCQRGEIVRTIRKNSSRPRRGPAIARNRLPVI